MAQCAFSAPIASARMVLVAEERSRGHATDRRLDKSGSPVAIQAPERACLSPCRSVGSRAAPKHNTNDFNGIRGTVHFPAPGVHG
jgi:hypothetical protein